MLVIYSIAQTVAHGVAEAVGSPSALILRHRDFVWSEHRLIGIAQHGGVGGIGRLVIHEDKIIV